jgi:hypothetical protein
MEDFLVIFPNIATLKTLRAKTSSWGFPSSVSSLERF